MVSLAQFKMYRVLKFWFPDVEINSRPKFLRGLELDFYSRKNNFAIELQGPQHVRFMKAIQDTKKDFKVLQKRDEKKSRACEKRGLQLFHIKTGYKIATLKKKLEAYLGKRLRPVPTSVLKPNR